MNFNLSEEQQMLRDGAQRYIRDTYDMAIRHKVAKSELGFTEERWTTFAELGWLALGLPEDCGGLGCSFIETIILMEEMGRGLVLEPYVSTAVLCARILDRCENSQMREKLLSAIAEGSIRLALAHLEPGARYQSEMASSRAIRHHGGYCLNGIKSVVTDAPSAHFLVVSACLDGDTSYSLFLVDSRTEGVEMSPYSLIDESRAADVKLTDVQLGADALISGPDRSIELIDEALDRTSLAHVAEALGAMECALNITADYIKTRQQFGQPIGKFQALQHRMAEMFIEVQETRSILYCGLAHLDAEPSLRRAMISAAKVVAINAARIVGGQGIQLHGGMGVTDEASIGHYYKKLIALEKTWGDRESHLGRLAGHAAC